MHVRPHWMLGVSATLLSLTMGGLAEAQQIGNAGRLMEQQFRSSVGNMIAGPQPGYSQNQYYGRNQPYSGLYQGQRAGYGMPGYQTQRGPVYYGPQGSPYWGGRQGYNPYYGQYQQGQYVRTQPTYDQGVQPTTYVASPVQRYQIPAQYAGTPPGYVITYGGRTYLSGNDGTMTPYSGPVAP